MNPFEVDQCCPHCQESAIELHSYYSTQAERRRLLICMLCDKPFSETYGSVIFNLKTPVSRIALMLDALNEGMGINAACRVFHVGKNAIRRGLKRFSPVQRALRLYSLCHDFLNQVVEGDELYTKIQKNVVPHESEGWTIVLMERASRFIWHIACGRKDAALSRMPLLN